MGRLQLLPLSFSTTSALPVSSVRSHDCHVILSLTLSSLAPSLAIVTLDKISTFNMDYFDKNLATVAAGLNVLLWMGLVCFPFIQVSLTLWTPWVSA